MTVTKSYTLWCEGTRWIESPEEEVPCGEWVEESFVSNVAAMRAFYKGQWVYHKGKDYCPACAIARGYLQIKPPANVSQWDIDCRKPRHAK